MPEFINGLMLCEQFFNEIARPVLDKHYPVLRYSAGLIGYGSDVLGYDDVTSTDHMWGPRFYLFLSDIDILLKDEIMDAFGYEFPYSYKGYSVNFSAPDLKDNGVRHAEMISSGKMSPLIFIHTIDEYLSWYLGTADLDNLTDLDWLSFSEHRLLALTSGKIFYDGLHIKEKLDILRFYPENVKLYLLASNWSLIAEEQAYVKRCFDVGDDIGSVLVCARIADRLMRLLFLCCNTYAPYSKWFGTAFARLPVDEKIKNCISSALAARDITEREDNIVMAQKLVADLHIEQHIIDFVDIKIQSYFGRNIKVIYADKITDAIMQKLEGTEFENYPLIGSLSQVANFTNIFDKPERRDNIKKLY